MGTVRSILAGKASRALLTTHKDELVFDAIGRMSKHGIGALVVVDRDRVVGIVTERDYLRKIALKGRSSKSTPVSDIMSSPVLTVMPRDSIDRCMNLMTDHRCRHLPVIDDRGKLTGVVSIGDCVKQLVREQRDEIEYLHEYISGAARA